MNRFKSKELPTHAQKRHFRGSIGLRQELSVHVKTERNDKKQLTLSLKERIPVSLGSQCGESELIWEKKLY